MNCRELIQQGMVWIVGDGKDISFWFDNWIGRNSLCDLLGLDRDVIPNPESRVSDFIQNQNWNLGKLSQFINNQTIIHKIIGIPLHFTAMKDTYCWGLSSSCVFTMKSATWLAHDHHYWDEPKWHFKWI